MLNHRSMYILEVPGKGERYVSCFTTTAVVPVQQYLRTYHSNRVVRRVQQCQCRERRVSKRLSYLFESFPKTYRLVWFGVVSSVPKNRRCDTCHLDTSLSTTNDQLYIILRSIRKSCMRAASQQDKIDTLCSSRVLRLLRSPITLKYGRRGVVL